MHVTNLNPVRKRGSIPQPGATLPHPFGFQSPRLAINGCVAPETVRDRAPSCSVPVRTLTLKEVSNGGEPKFGLLLLRGVTRVLEDSEFAYRK